MKICVYTSLIGNYEELNEQPIAQSSKVPFICFTDDASLKSDSWQIRSNQKYFEADFVRSQRVFKLQPHKYLPDYDFSIYIDNSIILKATPEDILNKIKTDSGFSLFKHNSRDSVMDEFLEVLRLGYDDQSRIFEQLNHYILFHPEVLNEAPFLGGILFRKHSDKRIQSMLDVWYGHVLRYSRRDQLSLNLAFKMSNIVPDVIHESIRESWFHYWLKTKERNSDKASINPASLLLPLKGKIRQLEQSENELRKRINELEKLGIKNKLKNAIKTTRKLFK